MTKESGINEWVQFILLFIAGVGIVAAFLFIILSLSGCVSIKAHRQGVKDAYNLGRAISEADCYHLWSEDDENQFEQALWKSNLKAVQHYLKK